MDKTIKFLRFCQKCNFITADDYLTSSTGRIAEKFIQCNKQLRPCQAETSRQHFDLLNSFTDIHYEEQGYSGAMNGTQGNYSGELRERWYNKRRAHSPEPRHWRPSGE